MNASGQDVLVVGAAGFLGRTLCETVAPGLRCVPAVRAFRPSFGPDRCVLLDICDPARVDAVIREIRPRWVINTAAETGVDRCEVDPERAYRVHVEGTRNLIRACESTGSGLIALSTNYVFDGANGPYAEADAPRPLNVYGRTKLESEREVLAAGCPAIVVRTAVLYGYRPGCRPNFVTWAIGALASGERVRVVTDEWANPTCVDELAVFLLNLCLKDFRGVAHFAGIDFLSRYEIVEAICACFGLDLSLVLPVTSAELGQRARRPLRAGLKVDRARALSDFQVAPFGQSLRRLAGRIGNPAALLCK